LLSLIQLFVDSKEAVFILNVHQNGRNWLRSNWSCVEQQTFIEELLELGISHSSLPHRITNDYNSTERYNSRNCHKLYAQALITKVTRAFRHKIYMSGGIHFVSSTVMVMDLLYKRVPPHVVQGFIVANAHQYDCRCLVIQLLTYAV
jgi:hypothetical protein